VILIMIWYNHSTEHTTRAAIGCLKRLSMIFMFFYSFPSKHHGFARTWMIYNYELNLSNNWIFRFFCRINLQPCYGLMLLNRQDRRESYTIIIRVKNNFINSFRNSIKTIYNHGTPNVYYIIYIRNTYYIGFKFTN